MIRQQNRNLLYKDPSLPISTSFPLRLLYNFFEPNPAFFFLVNSFQPTLHFDLFISHPFFLRLLYNTTSWIELCTLFELESALLIALYTDEKASSDSALEPHHPFTLRFGYSHSALHIEAETPLRSILPHSAISRNVGFVASDPFGN